MSPRVQFIVDRTSKINDMRVYIHPSKMVSLNLADGAIIRIKSRKKEIIATVFKSNLSMPVSNIQISRCMRVNLMAYLGQIVLVEPAPPLTTAENILFAPISDTIKGLTGDFLEVLVNSPYDFNNLPIMPDFILPVYAFQRVIEFQVVQIQPTNSFIIRNKDDILIKNQSIDRTNQPSFQGKCYDDIGGLNAQITEIRKSIELPILQPPIYKSIGIIPYRGIMLRAPSGCGKSLLAQAIQNESPVHFEYIPGMDLLTKSAEDAAFILHKFSDRAIDKAPSIVFFDNFDLIASDQKYTPMLTDKRLHLALLATIDRLLSNSKIIVFGAAREGSNIPKEYFGSNRFAKTIDIPLPNYEAQVDILRCIARGFPFASTASLEHFIDPEEDYTGADIKFLVEKEFALKALEVVSKIETIHGDVIKIEDIPKVKIGHKRSSHKRFKSLDSQQPTDMFGAVQTEENADDDPFAALQHQKNIANDDPFAPSNSNYLDDPFAPTNNESNYYDPFTVVSPSSSAIGDDDNPFVLKT